MAASAVGVSVGGGVDADNLHPARIIAKDTNTRKMR
jgi:hypothetical protein